LGHSSRFFFAASFAIVEAFYGPEPAMTRITFIEHNGTERTVTAENGTSVMEAAIDNGIPGIDADCGGSCSCATCHVFVDPAWQDKVGPPNENEEAMLSVSNDRQNNSRLSCQIKVTEDLDGLIVTTPEFQF
jgi:2Fe-2S ferredoxin